MVYKVRSVVRRSDSETSNMRPSKHLGPCLLTFFLTAALPAQQFERDGKPREDFGLTFQITPTMIRNFLDTVADDMANDYQLDDEQYYQVNEILHQRIPEFLAENRDELTKLATEFSEAWTANEPPDSELVAEWAARARPMLDKFQNTVEGMADDFRGVFNEDQIVQLDGYLAMMDVGSGLVDQRLETWAEGGFDAETDWHRGGGYKEAEVQRRQEMERRMVDARQQTIAFHMGGEAPGAVGGAAGAPGAASGDLSKTDVPPPPDARRDGNPTKPQDEWKAYTEAFITRFALDSAQTQKARLYYQRAAADRDRYERRNLPELTRIAKTLQSAKTPEERDRAVKMKARFDKGIEHMFERLKTKLEAIPTRTQKRAAAPAGGDDKVD